MAVIAIILVASGITPTFPSASAANACSQVFVNETGVAELCGGTYSQLLKNDPQGTFFWQQPALSPNGTQVTATRTANNGGGIPISEVYVLGTDGGNLKQVTKDPNSQSFGSRWLSDTTLVFEFVTASDQQHVFRIDVVQPGALPVQVTNEARDTAVSACHDGRIAFVQNVGIGGDVYIANGNTGQGVTQVTSGLIANDPAWTPDCRYLLFTETDIGGSRHDIYAKAVDTPGSTIFQVTTNGHAVQPSISSDWVMAFAADDVIYTQKLGTTTAAAQPVFGVYNESPFYRPGDGSVIAPTGFPPGQTEAFGGGDSYGAGEGAGGYLAETDTSTNRCHRSPSSYQQMVADRLEYKLRFHACSGAIIMDFYRPWVDNHSGTPNDGEIAQLDWLNRKIKLAMISVGGNNAHFPDVIKGCFFRDHLIYPTCENEYGTRVSTWISQIEKSGTLAKLYGDIKAKVAPGAKVLINEYPRFFRIKPTSACKAGGITFNKSDQVWINGAILRLNQVISKAAHKVGVTPVDTYDAFEKHELCTAQPWMHGIILDIEKRYNQQSFHPNALGYFAEAKLNLLKLGIK